MLPLVEVRAGHDAGDLVEVVHHQFGRIRQLVAFVGRGLGDQHPPRCGAAQAVGTQQVLERHALAGAVRRGRAEVVEARRVRGATTGDPVQAQVDVLADDSEDLAPHYGVR